MLVSVVISTGDTAHASVVVEQKVVHVVVSVHAVPPALHVCTVAPAHRVAPAVHAPVQRPSEQPLVQSSLSSHAVPPLLQLSTSRPTHRTAPGEQEPCPASCGELELDEDPFEDEELEEGAGLVDALDEDAGVEAFDDVEMSVLDAPDDDG
jgi:hypothetical protein